MRETSAVWFTKLLWASSSGDRLLVALPYKWDMSQLMSVPAITCTSQMRIYSSSSGLGTNVCSWARVFHTRLGVWTPVAFVSMPAGSTDSLCFDLRHNVSFDERIQIHLDVFGFQTRWFPSSRLVLIWTRLALGESFPSPHLVTGDIALFPLRRGLASAQNHEFTTQSETRFIFQLHFVTTIPSLTHFNGKRFLLRPVFLFIVFIGLFGLVLLRIFPFTDISGS